MTLAFRILTGSQISTALDDLARLRIEVFRDWPYLYDGTMDYEREYLSTYIDAEDTILVAAFDGPDIVGVATGTRMTDHAADFQNAFAQTAYDLGDIFYCAESVLLPQYRGMGAGHAFFDQREEHARELGAKFIAFCAVQRPQTHGLRPTNYRPLEGFWRKRGYAPLPGVVAQFDWKDIDEADSTPKPLQFWMKPL